MRKLSVALPPSSHGLARGLLGAAERKTWEAGLPDSEAVAWSECAVLRKDTKKMTKLKSFGESSGPVKWCSVRKPPQMRRLQLRMRSVWEAISGLSFRLPFASCSHQTPSHNDWQPAHNCLMERQEHTAQRKSSKTLVFLVYSGVKRITLTFPKRVLSLLGCSGTMGYC